MVTIKVEPTPPPLPQPQVLTQAARILHALLFLCCAAGWLSLKTGLDFVRLAFNALLSTTTQECTHTGTPSGTTGALVPGRLAAQCDTGTPSGTTGALVPGRLAAQRDTGTPSGTTGARVPGRSAAQRGCCSLKIISLITLCVLPSAQATPIKVAPTATSSSADDAATGLYYDSSGDIVDSDGEAVCADSSLVTVDDEDDNASTDNATTNLYYDSSGDIVDSDGEAVCADSSLVTMDDDEDNNEWTEQEFDEFTSFLSEVGIDDPGAVLQLVPNGMALMQFAQYYAQLDPTERARLCDAESRH